MLGGVGGGLGFDDVGSAAVESFFGGQKGLAGGVAHSVGGAGRGRGAGSEFVAPFRVLSRSKEGAFALIVDSFGLFDVLRPRLIMSELRRRSVCPGAWGGHKSPA